MACFTQVSVDLGQRLTHGQKTSGWIDGQLIAQPEQAKP